MKRVDFRSDEIRLGQFVSEGVHQCRSIAEDLQRSIGPVGRLFAHHGRRNGIRGRRTIQPDVDQFFAKVFIRSRKQRI